MSTRTLRSTQRIVHLLAAAVVGVYLYSPLVDEPVMRDALRFAMFPVLVVSGLGLWFAPRLLAARRRRTAQEARR